MQGEIYDVDYNDYVSFVGTAHFTRRSLQDAYQGVQRLQPSDLAIELDMQRFRILNSACATCPRRPDCTSQCEFVGATEALGNVDANIWLIDMSEQEIGQRIRELQMRRHPVWNWISHVRISYFHEEDDELTLWEQGYKDEVLDTYQRRLEELRRRAPAVWRVLIDERNTLMAARLAWIVSSQLKEGKKPKVLALVGAAHVDGIKAMLQKPPTIKENLERLSLTFTPPTLIRRVSVRGD